MALSHFVKIIRQVSERKAVGAMLIERYNSEASTNTKAQRLENIDHPTMYDNRATTAYEGQDSERAAEPMNRLLRQNGAGTLEAIMQLVQSKSVPLEVACELMDGSLGPNNPGIGDIDALVG